VLTSRRKMQRDGVKPKMRNERLRKLRALTVLAAVWLVSLVYVCIRDARAQAPNAPTPVSNSVPQLQPRELLNQYCVPCHNQRLLTAGLALDRADVSDVGSSAGLWEKVAAKLRTGEMPPKGRARPSDATLTEFISWLEKALDDAGAQ